MGAHVLVVDDDPHILRMLTDVLAKKGFAVDTAKDGEEAYERALAKAPDLLVTDVMMPKLDGWSLVRKLRLEPKLATLPVIFLTALGGDDDRIKAFSLGADDYVNKPFKLNDVVARVEKVLTAKSPAAAKQAMASSGLNGDLAQVGLSTLLVLVEMERKT
ncbi:MAG TPA: response regulator, partial [Kofleriaceae bacterium]|nr:response regulator [Kofleriaceae bacterium]